MPIHLAMHWCLADIIIITKSITIAIILIYLQMPIHLGMHWCLAAVDLRHMTINYYDRWLWRSWHRWWWSWLWSLKTCKLFRSLHHWSLTCSMGGNNSECLEELNDYLHEEYLAKKGIVFNVRLFSEKTLVSSNLIFLLLNSQSQTFHCRQESGRRSVWQ